MPRPSPIPLPRTLGIPLPIPPLVPLVELLDPLVDELDMLLSPTDVPLLRVPSPGVLLPLTAKLAFLSAASLAALSRSSLFSLSACCRALSSAALRRASSARFLSRSISSTSFVNPFQFSFSKSRWVCSVCERIRIQRSSMVLAEFIVFCTVYFCQLAAPCFCGNAKPAVHSYRHVLPSLVQTRNYTLNDAVYLVDAGQLLP